MKIRMPKPENLAKLTEEQRKVYQVWEKEQSQVNIIIEQALNALGCGDSNTASLHFNQLDNLIPSICEHGESVWIICAECDSIQKTLYPEDYDAEGNLLQADVPINININ